MRRSGTALFAAPRGAQVHDVSQEQHQAGEDACRGPCQVHHAIVAVLMFVAVLIMVWFIVMWLFVVFFVLVFVVRFCVVLLTVFDFVVVVFVV